MGRGEREVAGRRGGGHQLVTCERRTTCRYAVPHDVYVTFWPRNHATAGSLLMQQQPPHHTCHQASPPRLTPISHNGRDVSDICGRMAKRKFKHEKIDFTLEHLQAKYFDTWRQQLTNCKREETGERERV